jgi:glycosyltransferase involved in cell wall biosynthesis
MSSATKRVLFVMHTVAIGGMETLTVDVAGEFVRRGITVHAIVPENPDFNPLEDRFRKAGATVLRLSTDHLKSRATQMQRLARFVSFCKEIDPQVIHLHTGGTAGGFGVVSAARAFTDATLIYTEHDVTNAPAPTLTSFDSQSRHWVMRRMLDKLCHALMAVSRRNAAIRRKWLDPGADKFAAVLNGIPIRPFSDEERARYRQEILKGFGIDPSETVIGTLCRLTPGKGLDDLVKAFAIANGQSPCRLLLVGDGPLAHELAELAKANGVGDRVHFAGYQAAPLPYLNAMDIFALAVPAGSMSIALLEAMAQGLPCVITFCGPEEAVIGDKTGLCGPPKDPPGLAKTLLRLVESAELRESIGAAAAEHIRSNFSVARVADDWLEIYETCRTTGIPARLRADSPAGARPEPLVNIRPKPEGTASPN